MKLLDILVKNWKVWPAGQAVEQTCLGDVFCCTKGRDLMFGTHQISEDQDTSVVTKEMWAARHEQKRQARLAKRLMQKGKGATDPLP